MRPVRSVAVLGAATVLMVLPAPVHAAAETWDVPGKATITIRGHGYGHGHGMSQYGAEGAARAGLDFRAIASFYYPGTTWGEATGRVKVVISSDTTDDLVVRARSGLTLRDARHAEMS